MTDKKILNRKDIKVSLVLTLISVIGITLTLFSQLTAITPEMLNKMSKEMLIAISFVQTLLMVVVMSFLGLKLARATNLTKGILGWIYFEKENNGNKYKLNKSNFYLAIIISFICSSLTVLADKFIWGPLVPEIGNVVHKFDPIYLLSGIFYGGVVEEIILRLFNLSLIAFILYKAFARKKDKENIPSSIYWVAILISTILFALGHLPATLAYFGIASVPIILRMIIFNAIPGLAFGYLYWKKGLEYAIICHMFTHVFNQLIWLPILF